MAVLFVVAFIIVTLVLTKIAIWLIRGQSRRYLGFDILGDKRPKKQLPPAPWVTNAQGQRVRVYDPLHYSYDDFPVQTPHEK